MSQGVVFEGAARYNRPSIRQVVDEDDHLMASGETCRGKQHLGRMWQGLTLVRIKSRSLQAINSMLICEVL